jgi:hypothetical protein
MADPLTYGRLTSRAADLAGSAANQPLPVPLTPQRAAVEAAGITLLVTVAARHAHFLARPFGQDSPPGQLAAHLSLAATAAARALPDVQPVARR